MKSLPMSGAYWALSWANERSRGVAEFDDLVASRKAWITDFLQPWCRSAPLAALKRAELDWADIAGKVTADKTLWPWAWARFPDLVHET